MSRIDDTIQARIEKRDALAAAGINVHPHRFDKQHTIAECNQSEGKAVQTAGRIRAFRAHGKLIFIDLQDQTGSIQVMLRQDTIGKDLFKQIKTNVDAGDFIGVSGEVSTSKTGELTIVAEEFTYLGKSLRPLPSQWNAAENKEVRFRRRYVDMLVNEDTRRILDARWLILKEVRRYLQDEHDFLEVETPVFHPLYGGTNATPFTTHMNALDTDFYLRLAPELYLKRLVVGGYEKVFEIARNFRNEGIDQTHQPEFTMIEWYEAYADYHRMMDVTEGLLKHLVQKLYNSTELTVHDTTVDIGEAWPRITMVEALKKYIDLDFEAQSDEQLKSLLADNDIELIGAFTRGKAQFSLFDKLVTPHLIQPTWIIDYPRDVSPLSKQHRTNSDLAERFEGYIGGKELADGWSEIVDPVDQRAIWENEQQRMRDGDAEAHPVDENFLQAMEYGMPPLGGIGIGIDRLVMFLTNTWSIKEVIAFPTLRPDQPRPIDNQPATKKEAATPKTAANADSDNVTLPSREESQKLLESKVENDALRHHCTMVARAMEAYAEALGENTELWYQAGLLHDIDWEAFPDEHPNKAIAEWLGDYPQALRDAIAAHAPDRTGKQPETLIEKYLFACDELSGFIHAVSILRPGGYDGMKPKSIKKKLKTKSFAANVSREDIEEGFELIGKTADEHIGFLIEVFK